MSYHCIQRTQTHQTRVQCHSFSAQHKYSYFQNASLEYSWLKFVYKFYCILKSVRRKLHVERCKRCAIAFLTQILYTRALIAWLHGVIFCHNLKHGRGVWVWSQTKRNSEWHGAHRVNWLRTLEKRREFHCGIWDQLDFHRQKTCPVKTYVNMLSHFVRFQYLF